MRLGSRSPDEFIKILNEKNKVIQNEFLIKILELTKMVDVKVMMGDSTITEQKTFDPKQITNYLEKLSQNLTDWSLQDVSVTNNEDLRRIFTKFEINEELWLFKYFLSLLYPKLPGKAQCFQFSYQSNGDTFFWSHFCCHNLQSGRQIQSEFLGRPSTIFLTVCQP